MFLILMPYYLKKFEKNVTNRIFHSLYYLNSILDELLNVVNAKEELLRTLPIHKVDVILPLNLGVIRTTKNSTISTLNEQRHTTSTVTES